MVAYSADALFLRVLAELEVQWTGYFFSDRDAQVNDLNLNSCTSSAELISMKSFNYLFKKVKVWSAHIS